MVIAVALRGFSPRHWGGGGGGGGGEGFPDKGYVAPSQVHFCLSDTETDSLRKQSTFCNTTTGFPMK